mmetsp:Transcript_37380/g.90863  ORF Transcript_37380/g.90863 Transcript_37380/m.90863 type:complete len:225 (-) Transcript_37380:717-1391(-)
MSLVRERSYNLPRSGCTALVADCESNLAVIVTHPWGPLGGSCRNSVVVAICCWFQRVQVTTMRFDFAGSQIGRGDNQIEQIQEAANFLLAGKHFDKAPTSTGLKPPSYVLLVGYSYGSILSGAASAKIPRCVGVAMISPPLAVRHWLYMFAGNRHLEQCRKRRLPLLMMIGSQDNFTSEDVFMDVVRTMPEQTTTGAVLKDADHFFRGREKDLMDILGKYTYTK